MASLKLMVRRITKMGSHRLSRRGIIFLIICSLSYTVSGECLVAINHSFQYDCLRPKSCSANWTALTISDETYENLSSNFFRTCSMLIELVLSTVKLSVLSASTLQGLSNLKFLTISNVPLYSLSPSVFKHVPHLTDFIVSHGKTKRLSGESFKPCAELKILKFEETPLEHLESYVFSDCGVTLKQLRIRSGRLKGFEPTTFGRLTSLRLLDLTENLLVALGPRGFSDLSDLRSLVLRKNHISTIDVDAFQGLTALTSLDLTSNAITELNVAMLTRMPFLRHLQLTSNRIVRLDLKFSWPDQLLSVLIDKNRLLCRPQVKVNKLKLIGIPNDLPFCEDPDVTTAPEAALILAKSPKHQRFSAKQEKDVRLTENSKKSERTPQIVFTTPPWIFVWAISMTIGFVIACCTLVFIFLNRRKERNRRRKQKAGQALPLTSPTTS